MGLTLALSVSEDILTRGLVRRLFNLPVLFVLCSSILYVLSHFLRLMNGPSEWALLLAIGLAYATAFVVTGSLWAAVGLDWGWKLANVVPLLFINNVVRDRPPAGHSLPLCTSSSPPPFSWRDGGAVLSHSQSRTAKSGR